MCHKWWRFYFLNWIVYSVIYILLMASPIIAQYVSIAPDSIAGKLIDLTEVSREVMYVVYLTLFITAVFSLGSLKKRPVRKSNL